MQNEFKKMQEAIRLSLAYGKRLSTNENQIENLKRLLEKRIDNMKSYVDKKSDMLEARTDQI